MILLRWRGKGHCFAEVFERRLAAGVKVEVGVEGRELLRPDGLPEIMHVLDCLPEHCRLRETVLEVC